ncbi:MAG: CmcI family methyltransferase [Bacteroidota bacterium]
MPETQLEKYKKDMLDRVSTYNSNGSLQNTSRDFFNQIGVGKADYVYNFFWLGIPIIQIPQDLQAFQEIIWEVKPDLIIETGIAWGGSLVFSASMLAILEVSGAINNGQVLGIDIDIRQHTRKLINSHPLTNKITMLEGSSINNNIINNVKLFAEKHKRIMVFLDSNHTHEHVLAELEAYAPLVSPGSYCIVADTIIDDAPESMLEKRPWNKDNNPKTAVREYLSLLESEMLLGEDGRQLNFEVDKTLEHKLVLTGSPDGFLKRI